MYKFIINPEGDILMIQGEFKRNIKMVKYNEESKRRGQPRKYDFNLLLFEKEVNFPLKEKDPIKRGKEKGLISDAARYYAKTKGWSVKCSQNGNFFTVKRTDI